MPEYLSPGVFVEEAPAGARPIGGVGTSTAAFVGATPSVPAGSPLLVHSFAEY
jgi:phage tail sheath protein FI